MAVVEKSYDSYLVKFSNGDIVLDGFELESDAQIFADKISSFEDYLKEKLKNSVK